MSKLPSKQSTQHSECTFLLNNFQLCDIFFALADVAVLQEFATVLWVLWHFSWKSLSSWVILRITPEFPEFPLRCIKCSLAALEWIVMSSFHDDSLHNCISLSLSVTQNRILYINRCVSVSHTHTGQLGSWLFWALFRKAFLGTTMHHTLMMILACTYSIV